MNFIIIANAWSAGKDNPTSKHRIALELVRQGHRVLWIEGSGMRTPSVGSAHDRLRMVRKIAAAFRGARPEKGPQGSGSGVQASNAADVLNQIPNPEPRTLSPHSLWVLSPLFIPLPRFELVRRLNGLICRWTMRFWGWRLGFRDAVLVNYVPVLAEAMRGGPRREKRAGSRRSAPRIVYHCVDRWDAFAMYDSAMMGEMDRRCCRYADLVIASAGELFDRCQALNPNTVLIPHGVDWEHFRGALGPAPSPHGGAGRGEGFPSAAAVRTAQPNAVIGFFGLLSEWVDQDLILRLAREFAGPTPGPSEEGSKVRNEFPSLEGLGVGSLRADIVLIGKADVDVSRLHGVPNIHLLGPKPFAELPAMVARFTVGIIPFLVNDLTRSVNPIKLREMLSAGCPVVSSALPEVELYARSKGQGAKSKWPGVQVAHSHDEFIAMVGTVVSSPLSPEDRRALSDSMAGETWAAKVTEILKLVHGETLR